MGFDPVTLSVGAAVVGTGLSAVSMYQQSKAQEEQYNFAAKQAQANQAFSLEQAEDAYWRGEQEITDFGINLGKLKSAQKASYAASGIDVTSGSAIDVLVDTAEQGARDRERIRTSFENEATAYLMGAQNYGMQAVQYSSASASTASTRPFQVASSLLSGSANIYSYASGLSGSSGYTIKTPTYQTGIETGSFGR